MARFKRVWLALLLAAAAAGSPAASRQEQQAADLEYAREHYVMRSSALSAGQRQQALGYIAARLHERRPYSDPEFLTIVLRIAAFADNGHDYFDNAQGWWPAARLPLTLASFPDALLVTHAPLVLAELIGARIVAIEGRPTEAVLQQLHDYFGGPPNYVRWSGLWAVETAQLLHAMGLARRADSLQLTLRRRDGQRVTRRFAFVPYASVSGGGRMYSLQRGPQAAPQPLYLQQPEKLFRMLRLDDADALYLQFRSHSGSEADPILPFIAAAGEELRVRGARKLILDLRLDSGGNSDLSMELMETIARTVSGKIYIITGQHTFSAGIVTAAKLKQAAGARAVLVGAAPGDRLRWWSEGSNACLPNSRYCLHVTTGLWDLQHGCAGAAGCYGDRFGIRVQTLAPDLPAPVTAAAWSAGRDPSMEAIRRDLGLVP